jgi:hypothetical protein
MPFDAAPVGDVPAACQLYGAPVAVAGIAAAPPQLAKAA